MPRPYAIETETTQATKLPAAKALGIPFICLGAAEKNAEYRQMIMANQKRSIQHMFGSLEDMLQSKPCLLCGCGAAAAQSTEQCSFQASIEMGVSVGITGSPCNPYSTRRAKRFRDGNVASHSMNTTTMNSVVSFYKQYEPRLGITEQVMGFGMAMSSTDSSTPIQQPLVWRGRFTWGLLSLLSCPWVLILIGRACLYV